ncbi:AAA domain protein [uncultured archaeon]|nr:AAA domain protein [uncultured archaeon]
MLQSLTQKSAYFSMDNPYVQLFSIYEIGKAFAKQGYTALFIDEVHHYKNWKPDTKALYDEYTNLTIVAYGSSPLALEAERRNDILEVEPLSLSEMYKLERGQKTGGTDWTNQQAVVEFLAKNPHLYDGYRRYIAGASFPISLQYHEKTLQAIYNSMQKSIREDAVFLPNVDGELIFAMEKTLVFLASAPVGEFSINSFCKLLELNKYKTYYMVSVLQDMKILRLVRPAGRGAKLVRGEPKLLFYHPTMRKAVCEQLHLKADVGAMREEAAVFALARLGWRVHTIKGMKKSSDYHVEKGKEEYVIEVGGESKGTGQLHEFGAKTMIIDERRIINMLCF